MTSRSTCARGWETYFSERRSTIVWTVCFYILLNYMPTYTQKFMKISASAALWSNTIGLLVLLVAIPVLGKLSDRIGRKPLLLGCCIAYVVLPYPVFSFLVSSGSYGWLIAAQIMFALLIAMFSGPGPAASQGPAREDRPRPQAWGSELVGPTSRASGKKRPAR